MVFAELKTVRMHYEMTGEEHLPVLMLSNSLGASMAMWEQQVAPLASRFRLLRYDTRGLGKSSIPPGPYAIADLGNDVLNLLDLLQIESVNFCGLSMGGSIGQWLGIRAPECLNKLILASTAVKIGNSDTWNTRIATVMQTGLDNVISATLERWLTAGFRAARPEVVERIREMLQATDPVGYAANCAAVRDADFRSSVQKISVPTLVISGAHDPVTTPDDGRFLAGQISGASYLEIDAAHLVNVEAADRFNAAVLEFLAE